MADDTKQYSYELKPKYKKLNFLGVILNGKRVNLAGEDHNPTIAPRKSGKKSGGVWKGATQADYAQYWKEGEREDGTSTAAKVLIRTETKAKAETQKPKSATENNDTKSA